MFCNGEFGKIQRKVVQVSPDFNGPSIACGYEIWLSEQVTALDHQNLFCALRRISGIALHEACCAWARSFACVLLTRVIVNGYGTLAL